MNTINKTISIIKPVNEAIERTKTILFKPFNLEKWFIIGFCAWLAGLFEGSGGGLNFNFNDKDRFDKSQLPPGLMHLWHEHMTLIVIAATAAVILFITLFAVLLWLSSRGKFMFLDCLAKNKAHIKEPWKTFKKQANGLFGFRLLIIAAAMICMIPLGILTVWFFSLFKSGGANAVVAAMMVFVMILLIFIVVSIFGLVQTLTFDFVVPILYLQQIGVFKAWGKFLPLLWQNFWKIMLYLLFKLLILLCLGAVVLTMLILGCCFCCISIILFIPYIGTVTLLPLLSFYRLYSLYYLAQFGSEYDVFLSAA